MTYYKNIILFGVTSTLIYKKNLIILIEFHDDKVPDFSDKEIPKMNSNKTHLAVINLDSALKKEAN